MTIFSQIQTFIGDVVDYGADVYHNAFNTNYANAKKEILKGAQTIHNTALVAAVTTFAIALFATMSSSLALCFIALTGAAITYDLAQLSNNMRTVSQSPSSYLNSRGLLSNDSVNFEKLKKVLGKNMIFGSFFTTWALNQMELNQTK
jgi:hypothetical protein